MRREYTPEESYIEWLKSIGCTLYSPFIDGTMLNYIDGKQWYNNCPNFTTISLVDDGLQIVKSGGSGASSCIQIDTVSRPNLNVGDITRNASLSIIVTGKSSRNVDAYSSFFCDGGYQQNSQNISWENQSYYGLTTPYFAGLTSGNTTTWHTFQGVLNTQTNAQYHYCDCILKNTFSPPTRSNNLNEWNRNHFSTRLVTNATYTIKNCYGFSTALTNDEINTIYQHDQQ